MTNIYKINNQEDDFVSKVKNDLLLCDNGNNSDMQIIFQGYLHNKSGFKLRVENIEVFDDNLIESWKSLIKSQNMHADITADLSNSWVQITCRRTTRQRKSIKDMLKRNVVNRIYNVPFTLLFYICFLLLLIVIIWNRHKEKFQK